MFRITPFRVLAFIAVAIGAFFWPSLMWMEQVDECAVNGGVVDYGRRMCSMTDSVSTPPPRAWYERPSQVEFVVGGVVIVVLAAVFAVKDRVDKPGARRG